jgi:galactokinase
VAGPARLSRTKRKAWHAPGRVNLIGEHTDYNGGFVLPIAIGLGTTVHAKPIRKKEIKAVSRQYPGVMAWPLESVPTVTRAGNWGDYVAGVARELTAAGFDLKPMELHIDSTVPTGSGLSSSAALEVSAALALLDGRQMPKIELARLCQRAERNFVGMPCGIMDQYVSIHGEPHKAVMIDCRSVSHRLVPLPGNVEIVAVNTMVKHELGSSAYRERVAQCAEALSHFPGKAALRDVTLEELERTAASIPEIPLARARHVVLEDWRVEQFLEASTAGDLERMGRLFVESHRSLKDDYEVSCAELDLMVSAALSIDGCYGARMTGGGFGGCTVNLVAAGNVEQFESEIKARYKHATGIDPAVYRCTPAAGAGPAAA